MFTAEMMKQKTQAAGLLLLASIFIAQSANAQILQGNVEKDDAIMRINRPTNMEGNANFSNNTPSMRVQRPSTGFNGQAGTGLVDTNAFAPAFSASAAQNGLSGSAVNSNDFNVAPPKNFNLGADSGSRELLVAWEQWHKQLSQAIYTRWSEIARLPGQSTVRVTVTRDHQIRAEILSSSAGHKFNSELLDAIQSLNNNPGLSFPSKSERQEVSFEADYIASHNVTPGYSWVKNDYEHINENY